MVRKTMVSIGEFDAVKWLSNPYNARNYVSCPLCGVPETVRCKMEKDHVSERVIHAERKQAARVFIAERVAKLKAVEDAHTERRNRLKAAMNYLEDIGVTLAASRETAFAMYVYSQAHDENVPEFTSTEILAAQIQRFRNF